MSSARSSDREIPVALWAQFVRHSPRYGVGLLLLAAYQYAQYWFDTRVMRAINYAVNGEGRLAIQIGAVLVIVSLGAFVVRVLSRIAIFNGGRIAEYELRRVLLDRLQRLGPSFYRRMSTGEIMSRVTNDLAQVRLLLGFGILNVINTTFALVSALSVTLSISGKLTAAALVPLPILMLVTRHFSRQLYVRTRDNQDAIGQMSESVQSSIAGVRVVRSFSLEKLEVERFDKTNRDYLDKSLGLARLRGSMGPIMQAITSIGILVVFWYGGYLMLQKELDAGGFLAFYRALARLTWPLIALGFLIGLVQRGRASYSRLAEIYQAEPDIVDGPRPAPAQPQGVLEVRNLSFSHGSRAVLQDVGFTLPKAGSLAIVGRTGSGKSTLAVLLPRLQPTPRGSVFLDGVDICDLPLEYVRNTIAYAQQNAFLFSTTAGRNVGFVLDDPDSGPSLLTVRAAASEARILDELLALPDGLDTVVGERGVQLSGGQKQRIALARSFVASSRILVLDDPLSAVDARTERAILEAIDRQREQRSVILITHRVAAAARCDRILVLDAGRIVEAGTHQELLRTGGLYAAFAEEQRIERELERLGTEELPVGPPEAFAS
ncbi:MAG TPA: ABC transporter ATP-binding protein [Polyangiaceae bacterium]|nr:ABC transporter ATP-binding protein [Polyangiaceae bacterium]